MESLKLFSIISNLIKLNSSVKEVKPNSLINNEISTLMKEYLMSSEGAKKNVIPVMRQLALEQIRFLN